jgi:hypothetical protein
MKITRSRLKQIIKEETESDDRLLDAIRDLANRDSSDPELVRAIKKLATGLDDLDLSVDFLSAAMLDVDPLSIAGAQSALGRAASPAKRRAAPPPSPTPKNDIEEIIQQELEALLSEKSKEIDPYEKPLESPLAEDEDDWIGKATDPDHKGDCTPMTKSTCTPPRKALAKRFKKAAKKKDKEGGTGWQGKV